MKQLPITSTMYDNLISLLDRSLNSNFILTNRPHKLLHKVITIQITHIKYLISGLLIKTFL